MMQMNKRWLAVFAVLLLLASETLAGQIQIRNAARPMGQRDNQLNGVGLVVGLNGTGDSRTTMFTRRALSNLLKNYGVNDPAEQIKSRNVAAVMVTANMTSYLKNGERIDVVVSSLGDAKSLAGGTLVQTPLKAVNGVTYAVAQGSVSIGEKFAGRLGRLMNSGTRSTGRVPNGALIENEVPATVVGEDNIIQYVLRNPDYTSAARMAMAINETFAALKDEYNGIARARDASMVDVQIPADFDEHPVEFMAALEQVEFEIEENSNKVVVNERTGTVVMGMKAAIDTVAVAHGNLNVNVMATNQVTQPPWFSPGTTALYGSNQNLTVEGGGRNLVTLPESATIADLVSALNTIGASPRDLIAILQAIKAAGALHAELEIL